MERRVVKMVLNALSRTEDGVWTFEIRDLEENGISEEDWCHALDIMNGMKEVYTADPWDDREIVVIFKEEYCPKYTMPCLTE